MSWFLRWRRRRRKLCAECGEPLMPTTVPECKGTAEDVTVRIKNLPVLGCATGGHQLRLPGAGFGVRLIAEVFGQRGLAISQTKVGRQTCYACHAKLAREADIAAMSASTDLSLLDQPPFRIEVTAPGVTCGTCGARQIVASSEASEAIANAFIAAFREAHVEP